MSDFKAGDWVVGGEANSFRVVSVVADGQTQGFLVDKWGGLHNPKFMKKYRGAVSALEAAEAGKDEILRRVGLMGGPE